MTTLQERIAKVMAKTGKTVGEKENRELEEKLVINELSFNGFYDYCSKFLPLYLNNKKHSITETLFQFLFAFNVQPVSAMATARGKA